MKMNKSSIYVVALWALTVALGYGFGWWAGVKSVTHVAAGAVRTGFPLVTGIFLIVVVIAGIAAFRMRGFLDRRQGPV